IAYFDNAIDIASKIGEEHLSRWTMLLELAHAAHDPGEVKSRTAYRLARIAELSYKHMARDKYMDWDRLVESLMGLCPSFGIAILSRWRDREFGFAEELLPVAIYSLIERGLLPRKAAVALSGTRTGWERVNDIKAAIEAEPDKGGKKLILRIAYQYLRNQPYDASTWLEIKALADSMVMSLPDLDRLIQTATVKGAGQSKNGASLSLSEQREGAKKPDWDEIFNGLDLCDADAVFAARQALDKVDGLSYVHEFYVEGCRRAKLTEVIGYLRA